MTETVRDKNDITCIEAHSKWSSWGSQSVSEEIKLLGTREDSQNEC